VSLRPAGAKTLGTKAEVKNMNSIRGVRDALVHEIERQTAALNAGERIVQETRLWDAVKGVTVSMRSKEEAHDYRYFPEPDLVPMRLDAAFIEETRRSLPELPEARRDRFVKELGLSEYDAGVLTAEKALADYFETALAAFPTPERKETAKPVTNWITTELLGRLNVIKKGIEEAPVKAEHIAAVVKLVRAGTISGKTAKDVFDAVFKGEGDPETIVKTKGLVQVEDESQIAAWVDEVIAANAKIVQDVKGGKEAAIGSLVGQVMKKSQGRANPQTVNQLIRKKLLG
jgi:aspartyl-tRNA(Asn)/glutamyl-tRNA(Gln) amidotransferase subunit B